MVIEHHLIPELGHRKVGQLTVRELDAFASLKLAAVRQDRLIRNVARYGRFFPILLLLARTGLRIGEACGLRWRDLDLTSTPPRLTVVWQLDRWGELVQPKTATSRRTIPLPPGTHRGRLGSGSLKTFRATVATQLAEAGLHPSRIQALLGHADVTTTMTYDTAITSVDESADLLPDLH